MYELIKSFNTFTKKFLIAFCIYYCFVLTALYIFKPTLFDKVFYIPFIIGFCLSTIGFLINIFTVFFTTKNIYNELDDINNVIALKVAIYSILGLCISIFISYYYSLYFTKFLQVSFLIYIVSLILVFIKGFNREFKKEYRKQRE
jgi:hypothetical protein